MESSDRNRRACAPVPMRSKIRLLSGPTRKRPDGGAGTGLPSKPPSTTVAISPWALARRPWPCGPERSTVTLSFVNGAPTRRLDTNKD
ncbi:hypothetical protein ACISU4_09310 [Streptomyces wuyuanensis]|uniref:hypothetical protein n=1 Tax=Streptomyces wuyuanensis TaxID=1196353 RepID=UPI003816546A